jgi:dUTP pyrophosphatase
MDQIKIKYSYNKKNKKYKLYKKDPGDAGYDVCANERVTIKPNDSALVPTGVYMSMPEDIYCRVAPRSGLAIHNKIDVHGGVIDANYRGEVKVILFNHGKKNFEIEEGDRIASLIFTQLSIYPLKEVDNLDNTKRGNKGFGSSGLS